MELEKKKKLYAEDDISKLAVLKSNNDTVASKVGQNLRSTHCARCIKHIWKVAKVGKVGKVGR